MLHKLRERVAGWLRLGADNLVGPGLPSARADDNDGWNLVSGGDGPSDRTWTEIRKDLEDTLEGCERILDDEFSEHSESDLYMLGSIDEAEKR